MINKKLYTFTLLGLITYVFTLLLSYFLKEKLNFSFNLTYIICLFLLNLIVLIINLKIIFLKKLNIKILFLYLISVIFFRIINFYTCLYFLSIGFYYLYVLFFVNTILFLFKFFIYDKIIFK